MPTLENTKLVVEMHVSPVQQKEHVEIETFNKDQLCAFLVDTKNSYVQNINILKSARDMLKKQT